MKIAIIGLGLIGASIAKRLKSRGFNVIGVDISERVCQTALTQNIVDKILPPREAILAADVTCLCIYPEAAINFIHEHALAFNEDKILTDAVGIKREIAKTCEKYPNINYIGMHPMAGKEVSGIENTDENMFENANIIITLPENSPCLTQKNSPPLEGCRRGGPCCRPLGGVVVQIAQALSNIPPTITTPAHHDKMIAYTSQLPHIIALAMVHMPLFNQYEGYTGNSFIDMTRIGRNINMPMWGQLFEMNKDELLAQIEDFENALKAVKKSLATTPPPNSPPLEGCPPHPPNSPPLEGCPKGGVVHRDDS